MSQSPQATAMPLAEPFDRLRARLRPGLGSRALAIAIALLLELVLLLLLLALGWHDEARREVPISVVAFDAKDYSEEESPAEEDQAALAPSETTVADQSAAPVPEPLPRAAEIAGEQPTQSFIPVTPRQMESFDISRVPAKPAPPAQAGPSYGPQFSPRPGDSQRVGTAPNGQPMYAAAWYREPTHDELNGYLSTAEGPGWGMITCRTAPNFRVEDCVGLGEYPAGSRIERAALAAAWQFKVRPPRVNGVYQVGEWVRIRIDYEIRGAPAYGPGSN